MGAARGPGPAAALRDGAVRRMPPPMAEPMPEPMIEAAARAPARNRWPRPARPLRATAARPPRRTRHRTGPGATDPGAGHPARHASGVRRGARRALSRPASIAAEYLENSIVPGCTTAPRRPAIWSTAPIIRPRATRTAPSRGCASSGRAAAGIRECLDRRAAQPLSRHPHRGGRRADAHGLDRYGAAPPRGRRLARLSRPRTCSEGSASPRR
jgi:hypothetical protein